MGGEIAETLVVFLIVDVSKGRGVSSRLVLSDP